MTEEIMGTFQLMEIGRNKVTKTVTVKGNDEFFRAIKSCGVMSDDIEFDYNPAAGVGDIFVGGFRKIGTFVSVGA